MRYLFIILACTFVFCCKTSYSETQELIQSTENTAVQLLSSEEDATENSDNQTIEDMAEPTDGEILDALVEKSIKRFESFENEELDWYKHYMEQYLVTLKDEQDNEDWKDFIDAHAKNNQKIIEALSTVNQAFRDFRSKVYDCICQEYTDRDRVVPDARYILAPTMAELNNWYVDFMEKKFFPQEWEQKYQDYKKQASVLTLSGLKVADSCFVG